MQLPQCASLVRRMEEDWQSSVFYGFWFDPADADKLKRLIDAFRVEYIANIDEPADPDLGCPLVTESREFFLGASHLAPTRVCAIVVRIKYPSCYASEHMFLAQANISGVHVGLGRLIEDENWGYVIIYAADAHRAVDALDTVTAGLREYELVEASWNLAAANKL